MKRHKDNIRDNISGSGLVETYRLAQNQYIWGATELNAEPSVT